MNSNGANCRMPEPMRFFKKILSFAQSRGRNDWITRMLALREP
jgi:hypothetical protein